MAEREEISEAARRLGSLGGKKKGPKGFARMGRAKSKRIQSAGGKARWKSKQEEPKRGE